jgi:hypothetical protein
MVQTSNDMRLIPADVSFLPISCDEAMPVYFVVLEAVYNACHSGNFGGCMMYGLNFQMQGASATDH